MRFKMRRTFFVTDEHGTTWRGSCPRWVAAFPASATVVVIRSLREAWYCPCCKRSQ